ncbi:MAG: Dam family site-specific DNA-(adenine-N6)-methyltransferase [Hydrogenothermaceae bacterium]
MKPILKWAGSKYKIVENIKAVLPAGDRLVEPFVGSAALFLNTDYKSYLLNDLNKDLINFYKILIEYKKEFISYCKTFFVPSNNTKDAYLRLREEFNKTNDIFYKSALFLYLNRHGYNGLCRYNSKGWFNVPFGKYDKPYFPQEEMEYFLKKVERAEVQFTAKDFRDILLECKTKDVVYCDPPYVPLSKSSNFSSYYTNGFSMKDHIDLLNLANKLAEKGIPVLISNHNTVWTLTSYSNAKLYNIEVRRTISCNGNNRNKVKELLAVFR